jgi:uncharacterized membrane protein
LTLPNLQRNYLYIVLALVAIVAVSLYPLSLRAKAEGRNQAVTLAAELDAIETLSATSGVPMDQAVKRLQLKGLNAVTITDENIGELINSGQVAVKTISVPDPSTRTRVEVPALVLSDPAVFPRIQRGLTARFGARAGRLMLRDNVIVLPAIPIGLVRSTSVGLPAEQLKLAKDNNLLVIARVGNPPAATVDYIKSTIEELRSNGVRYLLPSGDQVLGHKQAIGDAVDALEAAGISYVTAEFGKMNGDLTAVAMKPTNVVRLHTAQLAELDKMSTPEAVDRFEKAARERNIRILLLRPVSGAGVSPFDEFEKFVDEVATKVRDDGASITEAQGYDNFAPPGIYRVAQSTAAAALFVAVALFLAAISDRPKLRWAILGLSLITAGMGLSARGQDLVTLLVTVLAPCAGFILAERVVRWAAERKVPSFPTGGLGVLVASFASFAGGLYAAGTMVGVQYLIKLDEFSGIKVAVFLPIVLVGVYFLYRLTDFKATLNSAITWGSVLLGVFLVAALAILISRTGNDGVGASGAEMGFRGWLDNALYVRPRTKEFLIGHPAMWIGMAMLARYRGDRRFYGWIALLLSVGAVGQTGIVNTLCHGHIPFMLSIARIWLGLALGSILGAVLWAVLRQILPKPVQSSPQTG